MKIALRNNVFCVSFGRGVYFLCGASDPLTQQVQKLAQKETTQKISLLVPSFLFPESRCPAKILKPIVEACEANHIELCSLVSYPSNNQKFWSSIHPDYLLEFDGQLFWKIRCKRSGKTQIIVCNHIHIPQLDEVVPHFVRFTQTIHPQRRILGESNAKKGYLIFL